jgi:hypothetical protein
LQHPGIVPILDSGVFERPGDSNLPWYAMPFLEEAHAAVGDIPAALRALGRYRHPRDRHFQLHLRCSPTFTPMEGDSTFQALLVIPRPASGRC